MGNSVKICAVVKANAYGFGLSMISKYIQDMVDYFAVARVGELEILRKNKITKPVLVLSPVISEAEIVKALRLSGEVSVDGLKSLEKINSFAAKLRKIADVHIKVDTGMNRFGTKSIHEFNEMLSLSKNLSNINIKGLYSHFACSGDPIVSNAQKTRFDEFVNIAKDCGIMTICHIASSKKSMDRTCTYDMVRLGIELYEINDSISFSGKVLAVKTLKSGEFLGYDYSYMACNNMRVACVSIGYGDIAIRKLSNTGKVLINGQYANIVGNVCMDCMFADITNIEAKVGDDCVLFGRQGKNSIYVCEVAEKCGTISYEILTSISGRVKREYNLCKLSQGNTGQENS